MKNIAVISEFNPFHNGHAYLISELKESFPDAAVTAIMSGSWVQRGEPAVFPKEARAEAAAACGADLVLELPAPWSMSGAEFFARAGVHIADCIGADTLAFGSESGDIASLTATAKHLASWEFADALETARRNGTEWSAARLREMVYTGLYGECPHFSGSNDLLALEYIKAIASLGAEITPMTIKRIGGEFGSAEITHPAAGGKCFCSATAVRRAIREGERDLSGMLPDKAAEIFRRELDAGNVHLLSELDTAAAALLGTRPSSEFSGILEISGGMENRLCQAAAKYSSIEEIIAAAKEKRYSESRLRRAIVGAMLGTKMSDVDELPGFTNVLAFSQRGREILAANRKNEHIEILSTKTACRRLTGIAAEQYAAYLRAERLYSLTVRKITCVD